MKIVARQETLGINRKNAKKKSWDVVGMMLNGSHSYPIPQKLKNTYRPYKRWFRIGSIHDKGVLYWGVFKMIWGAILHGT